MNLHDRIQASRRSDLIPQSRTDDRRNDHSSKHYPAHDHEHRAHHDPSNARSSEATTSQSLRRGHRLAPPLGGGGR